MGLPGKAIGQSYDNKIWVYDELRISSARSMRRKIAAGNA
jgi:hypothetical protein